LLRKDCVHIVEGLRKHGMKVSMLTDGGPLNVGLARALADQGLALMQPTLLAAQADLHDSLRGAGAFHETTRAIATAAATGLRITVSLVLTCRNWDQVQRVAELSFALGARGLTLSRFCPAGAAAEAFAELMPSATQVRTAVEQATAACRRLGLAFSAAITIPHCVWEEDQPPPLHSLGVCGLMGNRMAVTVGPDGAVRSCSLSSQTVGSALENSWPVLLQRLWERHFLPARKSQPTACRTCNKWERCLGGCRLSAQAMGGDFSHPDPLATMAPLNEIQGTYRATSALSDGSM